MSVSDSCFLDCSRFLIKQRFTNSYKVGVYMYTFRFLKPYSHFGAKS